MRRILIGLALVLVALPAWAQSPSHKWVKSGKDSTLAGIWGCVDQNSVVRGADGRTQYLMTTNLIGTCEGASRASEKKGSLDKYIYILRVNCNQDMSGKNIMMLQWFYRKDGQYNWQKKDDVELSDSIIGKSAKFVCHK